MPTTFSDLLVTEPQRERSLDYLQRAYAEGRITAYELDQRVETVLTARTRAEMNRAFTGLAYVPMGRGATLLAPRPAGTPTLVGRTTGGLAHLSGLATGPIGPAIAYGLSPRGSHARRESAKAFNFQLFALVAGLATSWLLGGWVQALVMSISILAWLALTLTGTARALAGEQWTNPVMRRIPFRVLDEGPRARIALDSGWAAR